MPVPKTRLANCRISGESNDGYLFYVYEIQPEPIEIDYIAAATELSVLQRRRSLVVILSNVREEDSQDLQIATDRSFGDPDGLGDPIALSMEILGDESPKDNLHGRPIGQLEDARPRSLQQIQVAKDQSGDAPP